MTDPSWMLETIRAALEGRYRVERLLGEGGMAIVYLAEDQRHRRRVAVKVLRPELAQTIGVERFNREIGIAARLNHPHILPLLDSGTLELGHGHPDSAYYVMPFVEGETLRDRLARDHKLPMAEALRLAREVADALDHAHRHGVIHRDIKPENILLSDQHAVVADFGIARALDEAAAGNITRTGQSLGSPTYMSPEQVTGEAPVDGRSDLYSLGCTLFEMLAGQPPWKGGSVTAVLTRRLAEPPPRIRALEPAVPVAVENALLKALAREPDQRFNTPAEFAAALEGTTEVRFVAAPRRRLRNAVLAGVVLLAAAAFALTRLARPGRADSITSIAIVSADRPGAARDTSSDYLAEGLQTEVANLLRRVPQLRVTAPSVVAQLQRQRPEVTYLELGQQLKVAAVLTWALTRVHDSVVVSAEVLKIPGGDLLMSLRYARPESEVATIQGSIAKLVADSLRLQLTGTEQASMVRTPTASGEAFRLYLRGRQYMLRGVPLGARDAPALMDSASRYARQALALDSSFAQPYGLLATYYFVEAFRGWGDFNSHIDSAQQVADRALSRDSSMGDAYINLVSKTIYLDDDWPTAESLTKTALHWASHDSQVLQFAAIVTGEVAGKLDSAITLVRRSVELEPTVQSLNTLGDLYMRAGRHDSAVTALRRALDLDASVPGPRRRLIQSLEHLKRYPEAIAVRRAGGDGAGAAAYEQGWTSGGEAGYQRVLQDDQRRQLAALEAPLNRPYKVPDDTVPQLREEKIAALYAQLGQWSKAMDWVLKEYEHRPRRFRLYVTNPQYRGLRNDPRFLPLVRREGLENLLPR